LFSKIEKKRKNALPNWFLSNAIQLEFVLYDIEFEGLFNFVCFFKSGVHWGLRQRHAVVHEQRSIRLVQPSRVHFRPIRGMRSSNLCVCNVCVCVNSYSSSLSLYRCISRSINAPRRRRAHSCHGAPAQCRRTLHDSINPPTRTSLCFYLFYQVMQFENHK
jgi:hypothetical protein